MLIGCSQRARSIITYLILYNCTETQCRQRQSLGETGNFREGKEELLVLIYISASQATLSSKSTTAFLKDSDV